VTTELPKVGKTVGIRHMVLRQLRSGDYARGGRLPSERALADRLGVSYMTVRKAITQLVDEGYLVRRVGQGTFVRRDLSEERMQKQAALLAPAWLDTALIGFAMHMFELAEARGWQPRLYHYRSWNERLVHEVIDHCDALMVVPSGQRLNDEVASVFRAGRKPVVFIGESMLPLGFDSVVGRPDREVDAAVDHLVQLGHRRIALAWQTDSAGDYVPAATGLAIDRWKKRVQPLIASDPIDDLAMFADVPRFQWPQQAIYDRIVSRYRQGETFSAIICPLCWFWAAQAAVCDLGLAVPDDVSIVAIGDWHEGRFFRPKPTVVFVSEQEHIRAAWELIDARTSEPNRPAVQAVVEPGLIPGRTTAPAPETRA